MDNIILPNEPFGATVVEQLPPYVVYVKLNDVSFITAVNSSAFLTDITGWIEIDRGYGGRFGHAQVNYFKKPIRTDGGAYRYKLVDGVPVECTPEEIAEQEEANVSTSALTQEERIATLEEENAMLMECLLEMSAVVYA